MKFLTLADVNIEQQRVLIREDLNVPIEDGIIMNDERLRAALPTIRHCIQNKARILIMSHLGRPEEGEANSEFSLAPVAKRLQELLDYPVEFARDWIDGITIEPGQVILCENVRFLKGENKNDPALAKKMAQLCDVFVMDAFATAHRAQASTVGVAEYAPIACAGPLLEAELIALSNTMVHPKRPVVAIVGGSKVSTKITLLENLLEKVDQIIVGGGIANTFLKAQGFDVGQSLYEPSFVESTQKLLQRAQEKKVQIPLPEDVVVAAQMDQPQTAQVKLVSDVQGDDKIFDVGPKTASRYADLLKNAGTIIWNGPVGVFEKAAFSHGTEALAHAIAASHAYSLAGGGDTLAALAKFGIMDKISYVSTGGGAFLEYLEGRVLPAVEILKLRYQGK